MNFLHLKYAIMVAETGSISKAAEKLYVAQPNVSRAIKELESDLNITIFERNSKGMIVTPEGEQLIHYAKRILRQIDDMEKIFKYQKKKNVFSISVPRASYISDAFVEFSKCLNNIDNAEVYYKETNAYRVINNVINEEYNLGILRYYINHDRYFKDIIEKKELKCELINQFKYVLIFNKNSALAENKEIHYSDLKDFIEIAHGDPYVPSLSTNELVKTELSEEVSRRIFVFERASQFELLANNEETFMWVSPVSKRLLDRYGLVQKECIDNTKEYKDLLIYRSNYKLSKLDQEFITKLCESKRNIN
ncbi:MAG: LysR family transcriptional regulator [Acholeplasmatales bacterium]|nr:LysR family transcriptional regulator [Acholeplasmatales bacterium]MDY4016632.1 LysR family transcriptional regulator [Bacilli bacterium]CDD21932.1 transcriptional regulator LysR family [Firmicutes bacterium CAG:313]